MLYIDLNIQSMEYLCMLMVMGKGSEGRVVCGCNVQRKTQQTQFWVTASSFIAHGYFQDSQKMSKMVFKRSDYESPKIISE